MADLKETERLLNMVGVNIRNEKGELITMDELFENVSKIWKDATEEEVADEVLNNVANAIMNMGDK